MLLTQGYRLDIERGAKGYMHYAEFLQYRFVAMSFLLGALRSIQFDRFRKAGLGCCKWDRDAQDEDGYLRPTAVVDYIIAKYW